MPYCQSCGTEIEDYIAFCHNCGAQQKRHSDEPTKEQVIMISDELPPLYQRKYFIWYLLSIVSSIFNLIYFYLIFQDLNNLARYPRPKNVPSTEVDLDQIIILFVVMVVGAFIFPLLPFIMIYIIYLKKYRALNDYLHHHPQKQSRIPASTNKILFTMILRDISILLMTIFIVLASVLSPILFEVWPGIVFGVLAAIATFGAIGAGIYLIIQDYCWQEALNERIRIINPKAPMKDFI